MTPEYFLDTNVVLYAAAGARHEPRKAPKALELIARGPFGTSGQVLAEFYFNATERAKVPLLPLMALEWVERLSLQPCAAIDSTLVRNGIAISARYRISYWDGAIVAAAETLGIQTLYSEDLNHGQLYGSVRAINPFLETGA